MNPVEMVLFKFSTTKNNNNSDPKKKVLIGSK